MTRVRPHWWALAAIDVAVRVLPSGPVRNRYRSELSAEGYGMSTRGQVGHAASTLAGAFALRRALFDAGDIAFAHTPLWCRIRLHHAWKPLRTPDGQRSLRCSACGTDDDGTYRTRNVTGDAFAAANTAHWY